MKKVLIGCVVLVVLFAGIGAVVFFAVMRATAGPEKVVQEFLAAAAAEDWPRAHDYFSAPLKEAQPLDQFTAAAEANKSLFKTTETNFNDRSVENGTATLSGTVTVEAGTKLPAKFQLVREGKEWRLILYQIGSS